MRIKIKIQDILLSGIVLLMIFNRAIPIDHSTLWQMGVLAMVYIVARIWKNRRYYILGISICLFGISESVITVLQYFHYLTSNHQAFPVTGTFDNPGPLGGFLAISLIVSISLYSTYRKNKIFHCNLFSVLLIAPIAYALILTNSRAGWLAALIGLLFLLFQNQPLSYHRKQVTIWAIVIFSVATYFFKADSANGRLFIWLNTWEIIQDYPILGTGTGGWLANYMHYQADYFANNPKSIYAALADNVYYPYNEFLHCMAEHGIVGILALLCLFYSSLKRKCKGMELATQAALVGLIVFSCFSYPSNVFRLQILFVYFIGIIPGWEFHIVTPKNIAYSSFIAVTLCLVGISGWSFHYYNKIISEMKKGWNNPNMSALSNHFPVFQYNPRLMHYYSQLLILHGYPADRALPILQNTSQLVPTCELYCDMGDLWLLKKDCVRAEVCYRTAATMLPCRIIPNYKLFLLYVKQGNSKTAILMGEKVLKQSVKKENTKTLRIKTEITQFIKKNKLSLKSSL